MNRIPLLPTAKVRPRYLSNSSNTSRNCFPTGTLQEDNDSNCVEDESRGFFSGHQNNKYRGIFGMVANFFRNRRRRRQHDGDGPPSDDEEGPGGESLFRSSPMSLIQLYIPVEAAQAVTLCAGDLGLVQFRDVGCPSLIVVCL